MPQIKIPSHKLQEYSDVYTEKVLAALEALAPLNSDQMVLMDKRNRRRAERIKLNKKFDFLPKSMIIGSNDLSVGAIRNGDFECSVIPSDLKRQWIQGTGPAAKPNSLVESSIRNVAYALLSGADGWMFDGEDALGQINTMSLDNQRNLKLAIKNDPLFLKVAEKVSEEMNKWSEGFLSKKIVTDWKKQLDFTTIIFRARGFHLDDRHVALDNGQSFSASIVDVSLYIVNNYQQLQKKGASLVLYLPKIQTAEEASFWNKILTQLESHLGLEIGTIKTYVLVEQLEATYQLLEIRAALGLHFVGFNTGRWDYINSVSDALCGDMKFINPNIESITMTYAYMAAYEDRVRKAVNKPDKNGNFSLWQGGMEPNIPVGSADGVAASMEKALQGARREQNAGASGKWVAHWKMVHIVRPVWEEKGEDNQLGRNFGPLAYTEQSSFLLSKLESAPLTIRGSRNLLSVALQYGNAFLQGFQAAALKPADFFGDEDILYLMEDMATGEIRLSVLWEWIHKGATLTDSDPEIGLKAGDVFTMEIFDRILDEEYQKLLDASDNDVHDDSKSTTLPIALEIVSVYVRSSLKGPWYIDLLNLNLDNMDLESAKLKIIKYFDTLWQSGGRITKNMDLKS
ncbi:MAG: malate synthase [Cyclobacteriaceae bacterium]|jgi:malate synthase